jgi:hypothetical protein
MCARLLIVNPKLFQNKVEKPLEIKYFQGASFFAEKVGFEPTIQFPVYKLSRLARSTTLTPLLICGANVYSVNE